MSSLLDFQPVSMSIAVHGDCVVCSLREERLADEDQIDRFSRELTTLIEQLGVRRLVLSLENVFYLTSLALGRLIAQRQRMDRQRGRLVLCQLTEPVAVVIAVSRMDNYFTIAPNVPAALKELQRSESTLESEAG